MEKEKVLQTLNELTKNMHPMKIGMEDYCYITSEYEAECFSHSASTDESVKRVKEVADKLGEDLINTGNDFDRFIMIIEYNPHNEMMMNEMMPIHEFCKRFIRDKKLLWGISRNDNVDGLKITLVASRS